MMTTKYPDFISEDMIDRMADKLDRCEIPSLCQKLGLTEEETFKIREINLFRNKKEGISRMLRKWKDLKGSFKSCTEFELFEALKSLDQEELAKKLFPGIEQHNLGSKNNSLVKMEAEYDIDSRNGEKCIKNTDDNKTNGMDNDEKCTLNEASKPSLTHESKLKCHSAYSDYKILSLLSNKIEETDAQKLFKELEISDRKIEMAMNSHRLKGFPCKCCYLFHQWKDNLEKNIDWKHKLSKALISIHRDDLKEEIFPVSMRVVNKIRKQKNEHDLILQENEGTNDRRQQTVSDDTLYRLSCELRIKEVRTLCKILGYDSKKRKDSEKQLEVDKFYLLKNWKRKSVKPASDINLFHALLSMNREDLAKAFFPSVYYDVYEAEKKKVEEQQNNVLKQVAEQLSSRDAVALFKELGFTEEEIQQETIHVWHWDTQNKYRILRKWWQNVDNNVWDYILVRALVSINCQDLVKKLFPDIHSTDEIKAINTPVIRDKEFHLLNRITEKLNEYESLFLFQELGIADERINEVKKFHPNDDLQKKYYNVLCNWKETMDDYSSWDCILAQALASINRQDLIKELFPDIVLEFPPVRLMENLADTKHAATQERELFLELIRRIGKVEMPLLFSNLKQITDEEIKREMDQPGNWQSKYCNLLQKWKEKMSALDWEFELVLALVALDHQDIIKDFFPAYTKEVMPLR